MSERYAYSEEEGFFVDMAQSDDDRPDLGTELFTSEVLELLNDPEFEKLMQYVRVEKTYLHKLLDIQWEGLMPFPEHAEEMIKAYADLSDETRKAIEGPAVEESTEHYSKIMFPRKAIEDERKNQDQQN